MQLGADWLAGRLVQLGADWCRLVLIADWFSLMQRGEDGCNIVQLGATWCRSVQVGAV